MLWPEKGGGFDYSEAMAELLNAAMYENYFVTFLECDNSATNYLQSLMCLFRFVFCLSYLIQ